MTHFSLYAIYGLSHENWGNHRFDLSRLPFEIVDGVCIEDVSGCFRENEFHYVEKKLGSDATEDLKGIKYALVHRFNGAATFEDKEFIPEHEHVTNSEKLLGNIAGCLRLIRPMRQTASHMRGTIKEDGTFYIDSFQSSANMMDVPEVQKLYLLRDQDADDLKLLAPKFLRAFKARCLKFILAARFHELGHWQSGEFGMARYMLWSSAIESIYTTRHAQHSNSTVAKARIKWFLDAGTSIYEPDDFPLEMTAPDPPITVGNVVEELYELRNCLAHGDTIPDKFFKDVLRQGYNGDLNIYSVLFEAQSFIIRKSLLRILRDGLTAHFADAPASEAYFTTHKLRLNDIRPPV